ncbi:hypothetical protein ACVWYN_002324 [Pedobacter sp. UYP24]
MKLIAIILLLSLIFSKQVFAQNGRQVSGRVIDKAGLALPYATIKLFVGGDSILVASDSSGRFRFASLSLNQFSLVVSLLGYQGIKRRYSLNQESTAAILDPIVLEIDPIALKGITVTNAAIKIKEDTIEYNAAAYKVQQGAVVEDAIKKMPGLEVGRDGSIMAQGKQISKVQLNGKDYMAGDVKSLTRTLPAELVQNVQVIDDHGEQAKLTGVKTGESQKVLNINIRKEKNYGYFAQSTLGGGSDKRYSASTNVFNFKGKRQITFLGELNNTNASLFDFNTLTKKGPNLMGDKQEGITTTRAFGINYRDNWNSKLSVYGSYSFARNAINTVATTLQENLSNQLPSVQNSSSNKKEQILNHRLQFNLEYKPDTVNFFKFSPAFSYAGINSAEFLASRLQALNASKNLLAEYTGNTSSHSATPDFSGIALFNHRFHKKGRNFNVLLTGATATKENDQNPVFTYLAGKANLPASQLIGINNRTDSGSLSLSYLEPLAQKSFLEFNYLYRSSATRANRTTDTVTAAGTLDRDPDLSGDYHFKFSVNRLCVNYRLVDKKYNFTLGVAAQPTVLNSWSAETAYQSKAKFNVTPVLRYVYNFTDLQALAFNYQGSSVAPTYAQLQPVTDFSMPSYPLQGNSELLPEFNNTFQIRYNKFGDGTGRTFFSTLSFTQTDNKIVPSTVNYPGDYSANPRLAGTILTKYRNASGFYNASAYYVLVGSWAKRKYSWSFNGNLSFNNNRSYLTDLLDPLGNLQTVQKNTAKNLVLLQGARFRADIPNIIDAETNVSYLISHADNSIKRSGVNNTFQTLTLGTNGKLYVLKNWTLGYDYSKAIYKGFEDNTNPDLLNVSVERRFLKNNASTIRFSAFDLFNENAGFAVTQNAYAITQTNVNRLGRYYLLSVSLRLQKFAGKAPRSAPGSENGG